MHYICYQISMLLLQCKWIKHIDILIIIIHKCDKSSHKQHSYICSNNQQYIVWVKIIIFLLCQKSLDIKIMKILSKFPIINVIFDY